MGISEEDLELAIKRIKHIITQESNTISSVHDSGDFQVIIELTNGMNLTLSSGELKHRADEQREEEVKKMDRHEIRQAIADDYIRVMNADALEGDNSLLNALLMGEGMTPISSLPDDRLIAEYKNLFDEDVIIND